MKKNGFALLIGVGLALSLATGCQTNKDGVITASEIRSDMSPELHTLALTYQQSLNRKARAEDHTFRQIFDDWDKIWLRDRPSRNTRLSIP